MFFAWGVQHEGMIPLGSMEIKEPVMVWYPVPTEAVKVSVSHVLECCLPFDNNLFQTNNIYFCSCLLLLQIFLLSKDDLWD